MKDGILGTIFIVIGIPKSRYVGKKGKVVHVCKMDGKKDRELYDVMFKDGTIWSLEPEQIKKETK